MLVSTSIWSKKRLEASKAEMASHGKATDRSVSYVPLKYLGPYGNKPPRTSTPRPRAIVLRQQTSAAFAAQGPCVSAFASPEPSIRDKHMVFSHTCHRRKVLHKTREAFSKGAHKDKAP